jgi:hypothetical protein
MYAPNMVVLYNLLLYEASVSRYLLVYRFTWIYTLENV